MELVVKFLRDKMWPISLYHAAAQLRSHVVVDPHISVVTL